MNGFQNKKTKCEIVNSIIPFRNLRSPLLFCVTVAIASQVCGMTAVIYFPDDLFSGLFNHTMDSEFSEPQQVGVLNVHAALTNHRRRSVSGCRDKVGQKICSRNL